MRLLSPIRPCDVSCAVSLHIPEAIVSKGYRDVSIHASEVLHLAEHLVRMDYQLVVHQLDYLSESIHLVKALRIDI